MVFAYEDRGTVVLGRVPAAGGDVVDVVRAGACVTGYDVAAGRLAYTSSGPQHPPRAVRRRAGD